MCKKNNAYCIVEADNTDTSKTADESQSLLLKNFFNSSKDHDIKVHTPEFRTSYGSLVAIVMRTNLDCKNYQEIKNFWTSSEQIKNTIFRLFFGVMQENFVILKQLEQHVIDLRAAESTDLTRGLIAHHESTIATVYTLASDIYSNLPKQAETEIEDISNVINFLISNIFIDEGDQAALMNTSSVLHMLEKKSNALFDAAVLKNLYDQKDQPIVFIYVGNLHAEQISKVLQNSSYVLKQAVSTAQMVKASVQLLM